MATAECLNHGVIATKVEVHEQRLNKIDTRLDVGEQRMDDLSNSRTENKTLIESLCVQLGQTNQVVINLTNEIRSAIKFAITTGVAVGGIIVAATVSIVIALLQCGITIGGR